MRDYIIEIAIFKILAMNLRAEHPQTTEREPTRLLNLPSHKDILKLSGLSEGQFPESKYREYVRALNERMRLLETQTGSLTYNLEELRPKLEHASKLVVAHFDVVEVFLKEACRGVIRLTKQTDLFPNHNNWFLVEESMDQLSEQIRDLKFALANLYTIGGFQATSVKTSREVQAGIGQRADTDLRAEYTRYDLLPVRAERYFDELIQKPEGVNSRTLLFGSGMASVTTVLTLAKSEYQKEVFLTGTHLYFENHNQTDQLFTDIGEERLATFDERYPDGLRIRMDDDPAVVFVETIGNMRDMPSVDVDDILQADTQHSRRLVVLDITLSGPNFDSKRLLRNMDEHTVVILVNSLQKLYQEGDGVAAAGALTVLSRNKDWTNEITAKLHAFRGMLGTHVTPQNVKLLQRINPEAVRSFARRIGTNVAEIATALREADLPVVDKIVTGRMHTDGTSEAAAFYIQLNYNCGQTFVDTVVKKAAARNIQLTDGASFGFKTTRLMVIGGDTTAVRICPGAENPRQISELITIFKEALEEL